MNDGELARRLRANGIPVSIFDERQLGPVEILASLRRLMLSWQPDIVHTHRIKENVLGSLANRLAHNVPSLRTVHGASEHQFRGIAQLHKKAFQWLDRWCARHLQQRLIAVSNELAGKLAQHFPQQKIVVIENGVDAEAVLAQLQPVDFRTREPAAVHVGIAGRLVAVKRVDLFLQAAQLLLQSAQRNWRFHIFGDGPLRATLSSQAEALQISGATTFHGHREDIVACLGGLDILIMCSDHEGLPMTALEAVVVGTRIAAHAVGGLPDALRGCPGTFLVEAHNAQGYAAAAEALAGQSSRSANARPHLDDRFSMQSNANSVLSQYLQLRQPGARVKLPISNNRVT